MGGIAGYCGKYYAVNKWGFKDWRNWLQYG